MGLITLYHCNHKANYVFSYFFVLFSILILHVAVNPSPHVLITKKNDLENVVLTCVASTNYILLLMKKIKILLSFS